MPTAYQKSYGLDKTDRIETIRSTIKRKGALNRFYRAAYLRFLEAIKTGPQQGTILEIGSGGGFLKELEPNVITSDLLPYPGLDRQVDATQMNFPDASLRAIFMLHVFHHIPDVERFAREAQRCLMPGGKIFMVDHYPGVLTRLVLKYLHHEPFDSQTESWRFDSSGPLSGGNTALAWIVFERDRDKFLNAFPQLQIANIHLHGTLIYWLTGGLKPVSVIPGWAYPWVEAIENWFCRLSKQWAGAVDIEIVRR